MGALAGPIGVAVMTAVEKAEQTVTHRPGSHVPARTLLILLGRHPVRRRPAGGLEPRDALGDRRGVHSVVTGPVAERIVTPRAASRRGRTSH
jgi:hypothetical protein